MVRQTNAVCRHDVLSPPVRSISMLLPSIPISLKPPPHPSNSRVKSASAGLGNVANQRILADKIKNGHVADLNTQHVPALYGPKMYVPPASKCMLCMFFLTYNCNVLPDCTGVNVAESAVVACGLLDEAQVYPE